MTKHIISVFSELQSHIERLSHSSHPHLIDVDVALDKTKKLYEELLIMQHTLALEPTKKVEESTVKPEKIIASKPVKEFVPELDMAFEFEAAEVEQPAEEQVSPPQSNPEVPHGSANTATESAEKKPAIAEKPSIAPPNDLSTKLSKTPIANIAAAIGINDRFLFIKELFNNNADTYNATMVVLNSLQSFADATNYIRNHFEWDEEQTAVQQFLSIVERRYL